MSATETPRDGWGELASLQARAEAAWAEARKAKTEPAFLNQCEVVADLERQAEAMRRRLEAGKGEVGAGGRGR